MKVNLINDYQHSVNAHLSLKNRINNESSELNKEKYNKRGYYGGSFRGTGAATNRMWNILEKTNDFCNKNEVVASNAIALILTAVLRPLAILPGKKDKEDKIYAASHSISSGVIGFVASSILMKPITEGYKKFAQIFKDGDYSKLSEKSQERLKSIFNVKHLEDLNDNYTFDRISRFFKMTPDTFIFGPLKAFLTISLIPPILKYVFGVEKKKKPEQQVEQMQNQSQEYKLPTPKISEFMEVA